jgi:hypothetical protein
MEGVSNYLIFTITTAAIVFFTGFIINIDSSNKESKIFSYNIFIDVSWIMSMGILISLHDPRLAEIVLNINYIIGNIAAMTLLRFVLIFTNTAYKKINYVFTAISLFHLFSLMSTNLIITNLYQIKGLSVWGWKFGYLSILNEMIFFGNIIFALYILYKFYKNTLNLNKKNEAKYILAMIIIGFSLPSITSILLPRFGVFEINWLGPITQIIWVPLLIYSIAKHKLFNTKIIFIEITMLLMWIIGLYRMFFDYLHTNFVFEYTLLVTVFILGVMLIKSIVRNKALEIQIMQLKDKSNEPNTTSPHPISPPQLRRQRLDILRL